MTRKASGPVDPFQAIIDQAKEAWDEWVTSLTPRSRQVCEQLASAADPTTPPQYHVLVTPDDAEAETHIFDTVQEVATFLRTKVAEKALRVYVFLGWKAKISKKPFRYLVHPNGSAYPLFDLPNEIEIQEDDMIGPDPDEEITSTIGDDFTEEEEPTENWEDGAAEAEDDEDEEDDEDAEDGDEEDDEDES